MGEKNKENKSKQFRSEYFSDFSKIEWIFKI